MNLGIITTTLNGFEESRRKYKSRNCTRYDTEYTLLIFLNGDSYKGVTLEVLAYGIEESQALLLPLLVIFGPLYVCDTTYR